VAWIPVHWYLPTRQIEEPWCPSSWYYPDMPFLPFDLVEIATRWLASLRYPCETFVSVSLIAVNVLYKSIWWGYPLCVCKILRNVFDMPFRSVLCCGRLTFDLYYSADPAYTQYSVNAQKSQQQNQIKFESNRNANRMVNTRPFYK